MNVVLKPLLRPNRCSRITRTNAGQIEHSTHDVVGNLKVAPAEEVERGHARRTRSPRDVYNILFSGAQMQAEGVSVLLEAREL
jgi:hypothetical protein